MYSLVSCIGCFILCPTIVRCRTCFLPSRFPYSFNNCHISINNWQTLLRKQYNKRDPQANPLGPDPKINAFSNQDDDIEPVEREVVDTPTLMTLCSPPHTDHSDDRNVKLVLHHDENNANMREKDTSINWLHLPMLTKLESMHTLIEWQFQHPTRLRNIMKSDDELALWVRSFQPFYQR